MKSRPILLLLLIVIFFNMQCWAVSKNDVENVRFEKRNGKYIIKYDLKKDAIISVSATNIGYHGKVNKETIYELNKKENEYVVGDVGYVMAGKDKVIEWNQYADKKFNDFLQVSEFDVRPKNIFNSTKTTLLGTFGYSFVPEQMSYGGFIGFTSTKNGWGAFAHFRSNFKPKERTEYVCDADGKINECICYFTGAVRKQYFMFDFGIMYNMWQDKRSKSMMSLGLGCGYGQRNVYWQIDSNDWAFNQDLSLQGVTAELNLMGSIKGITMMMGVNTLNFKYVELEVGVGITF